MEHGEIELALTIGGRALRAIRCDIEEGLSDTGRVTAEVVTNTDVPFHELIEADARVVITVGGVAARQLSLRLGAATFDKLENGGLHYIVELYPAFWFLQLGVNTRKFRDQPTEAIVSKVLDEQGVLHTWRNQRKSESRPYTVQYRETNLAFVQRLLECEGFYFRFDPDGTMIIADKSSSEPLVAGKSAFELQETDGALAHGELGITSMTKGAVLGPGRATVNDYNFKKPHTSLLATAASDRDADLDVYEYMVGFRDPGVGATLAKLRMEAHVCQRRFVEGTSTVPSFAPGRRFTFSHGEAIDFSGGYLLVRITHHFHASHAGDDGAGYENVFEAIPEAIPFRPKIKTPVPVVHGNHTTMVRGPHGEEIHTDQHGRAKVQFHWDREAKGTDEDSRWIRVLQETSSSLVLSRVGWEIVTGYVNGDPDRPIGLGRNINGQMMPTYGQPSHKNIMTIKTESYPGKNGFNELRLDDTAGAMRMDWHAQHDMQNIVENDRTEKVMNDHTQLVKAGVDRVVEKNQDVQIGGNETRDVQQNYTETVKKDRKETIGGDETVNVVVSSTMAVKQDDKEKVSGSRRTLTGVGGVKIPGPKDVATNTVPHTLGASEQDISGGLAGGEVEDETTEMSESPEAIASGDQDGKNTAIKRDTRQTLKRDVDGSVTVISGETIVNGANYLFREIVDGSKVTLSSAGSIAQSASKFLIHKVKGLILRKSKEDMSNSAKRSVVIVKGTASLHSDEKVELRGKVIEIEGQEKVVFQSAELVIELTPTTTTIKGDIKMKAAESIDYVGNPDKLTA